MVFVVHPFEYHSGDIPFPEWISIFTVSLAPLVAHIASGVPHTSYLACKPRPRWHDHVGLYNPTSILWRYAAIADRRMRAREWSEVDMAASNALFWTTRGWDGSEEMVALSVPYCTRLPDHSRVAIASWETAKTVLITLQAAQAAYIYIQSTALLNGIGFVVALDTIFFPVALLGVLRLVAAFWLTDEYGYNIGLLNSAVPELDQSILNTSPTAERQSFRSRPVSIDSLAQHPISPGYASPCTSTSRFRSCSYVPSRLLRLFYHLLLMAVWVSTFTIFAHSERSAYSVTGLIMNAMFLTILTFTVLIFGYYFWIGKTTSTVLPCLSHTWYKAYSVALVGLMISLIVVASLETQKTSCGRYVTIPTMAELLCASEDPAIA